MTLTIGQRKDVEDLLGNFDCADHGYFKEDSETVQDTKRRLIREYTEEVLQDCVEMNEREETTA